jgi:hypothetical protein
LKITQTNSSKRFRGGELLLIAGRARTRVYFYRGKESIGIDNTMNWVGFCRDVEVSIKWSENEGEGEYVGQYYCVGVGVVLTGRSIPVCG